MPARGCSFLPRTVFRRRDDPHLLISATAVKRATRRISVSCRDCARLPAPKSVCRSGSFGYFQIALLQVAHPKKDRSLITRGGSFATPAPIKRKRGSAWICPVVPHRPSRQNVRALFLEGFPAKILHRVFVSTLNTDGDPVIHNSVHNSFGELRLNFVQSNCGSRNHDSLAVCSFSFKRINLDR